MKEKYSEWLLVSDIDGTLLNKKSKLPEKNKLAIHEFINNGGNFALCSGRNLQSVKRQYANLGIKSHALFLNGAGVYDCKKDKVVYYYPIPQVHESYIREAVNKFKTMQFTVYTQNMIYLYKKTCFYGLAVGLINKIDFKYVKTLDELPKGKWGKVTFFGTKGQVKQVEEYFKNNNLERLFDTFKTSPFALEVVAKHVNKGMAVSLLSEELNINKNNIAAIGDYYNDVDMLKFAAHPVCCEQSPNDIKNLCEKVVCHCNDGAVSEFINYIEKNYIL